MLKKRYRIAKKKEFDLVFKDGKSFFVKNLGIKILKNSYSFNRFGIIVGKKVSKKSVERNKVKRLIKVVLYDYIFLFKEKYDIIVIVQPSGNSCCLDDFKKDLYFCFSRLKIL